MSDELNQGLVPAIPLAVDTPGVPTIEQVGNKPEIKRDASGKIVAGSAPLNPEGVGGFQDHPEIINERGRPKKQESFTWWINHFKNMSEADLLNWEKQFSAKERSVAAALAYARVVAARGSLKDFREVADRSEGRSPQTIVFEGGFFSQQKLQILEVASDLEIESETEASA